MRTWQRSIVRLVARRPWGTGGLHQRKDGRWVGSVPATDGVRQRVYVTGKDRAKVRASLTKLRTRSSSGGTDTLAAFLDRWLDDAVTSTVRARTLDGYQTIVRDHLAPTIGKIRLDKLTPADVLRWQNRQLAEYHPRSVSHQSAVLRAALRQAVAWGMLDRNPAAAVKGPRVERSVVPHLSAAEALQFLAFVKGQPLEALYVLALTTGMRQGELLGLKWAQVDLIRGKLQVTGSLVRMGRKYRVEPPKTDKSMRSLQLTARAVAALRAHEAAQIVERTNNPERVEQGYVFARPLGSPLANFWVTKEFQAQLAAAKLPKTTFHAMRHTCASLLISEGVPLASIQALLGHATISITVDIYGHLTDQAKQEAVDRMEGVLG